MSKTLVGEIVSAPNAGALFESGLKSQLVINSAASIIESALEGGEVSRASDTNTAHTTPSVGSNVYAHPALKSELPQSTLMFSGMLQKKSALLALNALPALFGLPVGAINKLELNDLVTELSNYSNDLNHGNALALYNLSMRLMMALVVAKRDWHKYAKKKRINSNVRFEYSSHIDNLLNKSVDLHTACGDAMLMALFRARTVNTQSSDATTDVDVYLSTSNEFHLARDDVFETIDRISRLSTLSQKSTLNRYLEQGNSLLRATDDNYGLTFACQVGVKRSWYHRLFFRWTNDLWKPIAADVAQSIVNLEYFDANLPNYTIDTVDAIRTELEALEQSENKVKSHILQLEDSPLMGVKKWLDGVLGLNTESYKESICINLRRQLDSVMMNKVKVLVPLIEKMEKSKIALSQDNQIKLNGILSDLELQLAGKEGTDAHELFLSLKLKLEFAEGEANIAALKANNLTIETLAPVSVSPEMLAIDCLQRLERGEIMLPERVLGAGCYFSSLSVCKPTAFEAYKARFDALVEKHMAALVNCIKSPNLDADGYQALIRSREIVDAFADEKLDELKDSADELLYRIYRTIVDEGLIPAKKAITTYVALVGSNNAEHLLGLVESLRRHSTHTADSSSSPFFMEAESRADKLAKKLFKKDGATVRSFEYFEREILGCFEAHFKRNQDMRDTQKHEMKRLAKKVIEAGDYDKVDFKHSEKWLIGVIKNRRGLFKKSNDEKRSDMAADFRRFYLKTVGIFQKAKKSLNEAKSSRDADKVVQKTSAKLASALEKYGYCVPPDVDEALAANISIFPTKAEFVLPGKLSNGGVPSVVATPA